MGVIGWRHFLKRRCSSVGHNVNYTFGKIGGPDFAVRHLETLRIFLGAVLGHSLGLGGINSHPNRHRRPPGINQQSPRHRLPASLTGSVAKLFGYPYPSTTDPIVEKIKVYVTQLDKQLRQQTCWARVVIRKMNR